SLAEGLIGEKDYSRFREVLRKTYYSKEKSLRKAGYAASTMWRFLNEMNVGDWVVVPYWGGVFYLAETSAEAGDLVDDIFEALRLAAKKSTRAQSPSADLFSDQLRVEMIETDGRVVRNTPCKPDSGGD